MRSAKCPTSSSVSTDHPPRRWRSVGPREMRGCATLPSPAETWPRIPPPVGLAQWQERQGNRIIADAIKIAQQSIDGRSHINSELLVGATVATLIDLSKEAEMIVVGRRGRGALPQRPLGSVSSELVQRAYCPVRSSTMKTRRCRIPRRRRSWSGLTARRHRSWRQGSRSIKRRDAAWSWWPCMSFPVPTGRRSNPSKTNSWPSVWRAGKNATRT